MRAAFALAALMLGACGQPSVENREQPAPAPRKAPAPAPKAEPAPTNLAEAAPKDDPGLEAMSPSRRRAYDRGLADCRAGRYDPDPYPEAYRIGCAAAHDR